MPSFQEDLVPKMEYIPNATKFGTLSELVNHKCNIWNCGSWPEIKIQHSEQTEHVNYEYKTPQGLEHLRDWLKLIRL